jgi:penicillin-binding protein 1C
VALDEISPALRAAIVQSEDRHFWEHGGVDWAALARSAWQTALHDRTQGGSTLTMQLAGLLDEDLARPAGGRSLVAKAHQIARAQALEARWPKADILEAYLNLVPLRGELVGVPAAAQALFGKYPGGLDAQEAAILAVMVRGPNAPAPVLARRACELLALGQQSCTGLDSLVARACARRGQAALGPQWAPHAARRAWQLQARSTTATPS